MLVLVLILVVIALVLLLAGWFLHLVVLAWTSVAISVLAGLVLLYDWWQVRSAIRSVRQAHGPRPADRDAGHPASADSAGPGRGTVAGAVGAGAVGAAGAGTATGLAGDGPHGVDMEPATQVLPVIRPDVSASEETTRLPVIEPSGSEDLPSGASRSSGLSSPSVTNAPGSSAEQRHPDVARPDEQAAVGSAAGDRAAVDHSASHPAEERADSAGRTDGADGVTLHGRGGDRAPGDDPDRAGRDAGAEPAGAGQLRTPQDAPGGRDVPSGTGPAAGDGPAAGAGPAGAGPTGAGPAGAGAAGAGAVGAGALGAAALGAAGSRGAAGSPDASAEAPGRPIDQRGAGQPGTGQPGGDQPGAGRTGADQVGAGQAGPVGGTPAVTGDSVPVADGGPTTADGATTAVGAADAGQAPGERTVFLSARDAAPVDAAPTGEAPEEPRDAAVAAAVARLPDEVVVIDEHPRYHLQACRSLPGHAVIPLPVSEAVELGFTPCGWCTPNRTLAERHPAEVR